jgi:flagellar hook protein FlgE
LANASSLKVSGQKKRNEEQKMSLYGALFSGVSGLTANSNAMGMISDNITNLNTVGYKGTDAQFVSLVTAAGGGDAYAPGGVKSTPRSLIDKPGLLQTSNSATDLSIEGAGFFVVKKASSGTAANGEIQFTRSGSFSPDDEGFLRNTAGLYLQGYKLDPTSSALPNLGDLTQLQTINISTLTGTAEATTTAVIRANLKSTQTVNAAEGTYNAGVSANNMASGTIPADFSRDILVYDAQGGSKNLTMSFLKTSTPNQWHVEIYANPASEVTTGLVDGQVVTGTVAFNQDGTLDLTNTSASLKNPIGITWTGGVAPSSITLNLGTDGQANGMTQFASDSALISSSVDGAVFGNVIGVKVGDDGVVTALFDNGLAKAVYQLPIATFQNPNGLSRVSGNAYVTSDQSGTFALQTPASGGAGTIAPSTLEASNIDLGTEFVKLITTQRAFSASTKIITTADEMLTELNQVKR